MLVLGNSAYQKMKQISTSNDTIRDRIDDLAASIKRRLISKM